MVNFKTAYFQSVAAIRSWCMLFRYRHHQRYYNCDKRKQYLTNHKLALIKGIAFTCTVINNNCIRTWIRANPMKFQLNFTDSIYFRVFDHCFGHRNFGDRNKQQSSTITPLNPRTIHTKRILSYLPHRLKVIFM